MNLKEAIAKAKEIQQRPYVPLTKEQKLVMNQYCLDACGIDCHEVIDSVDEFLTECQKERDDRA